MAVFKHTGFSPVQGQTVWWTVMFITFTKACNIELNHPANLIDPPVELQLYNWRFKADTNCVGIFTGFGISTCQPREWLTIPGSKLLNIELGIPFAVYESLGDTDMCSPVTDVSSLRWDLLDDDEYTFELSLDSDGKLSGWGHMGFDEFKVPEGHPIVLVLEPSMNSDTPIRAQTRMSDIIGERLAKRAHVTVPESMSIDQ